MCGPQPRHCIVKLHCVLILRAACDRALTCIKLNWWFTVLEIDIQILVLISMIVLIYNGYLLPKRCWVEIILFDVTRIQVLCFLDWLYNLIIVRMSSNLRIDVIAQNCNKFGCNNSEKYYKYSTQTEEQHNSSSPLGNVKRLTRPQTPLWGA